MTNKLEPSEEWVVIADACAACSAEPTWGAFICSFRIHRGDSARSPSFEGAWLSRTTGINRAELLAVTGALHALVVGIETDDWAAMPVRVVSDSQLVINLMNGRWRARDLAPMYNECRGLVQRLEALTGRRVIPVKCDAEMVAGADELGRRFKQLCDKRHQRNWQDKQRVARSERDRRARAAAQS